MRKLKPEKQFYKKRLLDPSQQFVRTGLQHTPFFFLKVHFCFRADDLPNEKISMHH